MLLMQSLNKLDSPEQKLEAIIKKHAELVSGRAQRHKDQPRLQKMLTLTLPAAGGAPQRPEAAEGPAEEAAAGGEGEGPAAERAQPGRAGPQ